MQIDEVEEGEWADLLSRFDDASIYQTWPYGAVCWGANQLSHVVLKNSGRVVSIAQLRIVQVPVIKRGIAYLRWGPVFRIRGETLNQPVLHQMTLALKQEYQERRGLLLRLLPGSFAEDPVAAAWQSVAEGLGLRRNPRIPPYQSLRLDLTVPMDLLRKGLDQKWRNQLNAAERNGLKVHIGCSAELFAGFVTIYREMRARKHFDSGVDVSHFQRIQDRLPTGMKMLVLLAEQDGKPVNGVVASALGDTGTYLLGATAHAGMKSKGAYLLQWRLIETLIEQGCRWYDLGGIDPERNPGVYHFKQGLEGKPVRQVGCYQCAGNRLSALAVGIAELGRATCLRLKCLSGSP